ncbi:hypothetical protein OG782_36960 [Streptomyces sp. NBC_00876]|uniref:hypothetical protein n=1 Tax=Streptomyces sp. NBC_00876 TaxID=2975853 RepID=UPI00386EAA19|nr:hypothetical protein OG782_36960 [Streptomyces sp. NBC_00876]
MMEESNVGEQATGILARLIRSSALPSAAGRELRRLVTERLRASDFGAQALARLEERPEDANRAATVGAVLSEEAEKDSGFAEQLRTAVQQVNVNEGPVAGSISGQQSTSVSGAGAIGVSTGSIGGSQKITGTKNKSVAIGVAAVAVVSVSIGGAVYYQNQFGGESSSSESGSASDGSNLSSKSVASIGAERGKAGVQEVWDAMGDGLQRHDYKRMCALYTPEARTELERSAGDCEEYMETAAQSMDTTFFSVDGDKILVRKIEVKGRAAALTVARSNKLDDPGVFFLERFADRWRISAKDLSDYFPAADAT